MFKHIFKANPYHGKDGRFTTSDKATGVAQALNDHLRSGLHEDFNKAVEHLGFSGYKATPTHAELSKVKDKKLNQVNDFLYRGTPLPKAKKSEDGEALVSKSNPYHGKDGLFTSPNFGVQAPTGGPQVSKVTIVHPKDKETKKPSKKTDGWGADLGNITAIRGR